MTVDFASGVTIVLTVLGIIAVIAAAAAVARSSYVKAQLEALRGDRDDQALRIDRLEAEDARKDKLIAELTAKNAVLEKLVRGDGRLERIESVVNEIKARIVHE